jgi:hypothetical protein
VTIGPACEPATGLSKEAGVAVEFCLGMLVREKIEIARAPEVVWPS